MNPANEADLELHRSLVRQLRRAGLTSTEAPSLERWRSHLGKVSLAYADADSTQYTLERSMEVSSSEMRDLFDALSRQASTDALTGLRNRKGMMHEVGHALAQPLVASEHPPSLMFFDLDGFKLVNDRLGHAAGDEVLRVFADRLCDAVRGDDLVGRIGGDEFLVLGTSPGDPDQLSASLDRIISEVTVPVEVGGELVTVGTSAGAAIAKLGETLDEFVERADAAMYKAKHMSRKRTALQNTATHMSLGNGSELRRAISAGELILHYQPLVCLADRSTIGFEALVRWQHPTRGMVPPNEFIPDAEQSGSIHELTRWVLAEAVSFASTVPSDLLMSVNVSAKDLELAGFAEMVIETVDATTFSADRLILEITEASIVSSATVTARNLGTLTTAGVQISIDDFGSGYSGLSYLADVPAKWLKLDRSLVARAATCERVKAILAAVIELAATFELDVVAEGIEQDAEAALMALMGSGYGQGYIFGRPEAWPAGLDSTQLQRLGPSQPEDK